MCRWKTVLFDSVIGDGGGLILTAMFCFSAQWKILAPVKSL